MSQRSTAQHYHTDTPFCTIRKSHVTWNFAVPGPHSEEIRRCILLFLCTLGTTLAKKIETAARTWHRRVIYQACTRLCLACVPVSIFLARVVVPGNVLCGLGFYARFLFAIETSNSGTIVLSIFSTILAKTSRKRFLFCEERQKLYRLVAGHCVCTAGVNTLVLFSRFWSSSCR